MKKYKLIPLLLIMMGILSSYTVAMADPIVSADYLEGQGTVCVSADSFLESMPQSEAAVENGNRYGKSDYWGTQGLSYNMSTFMQYGSPSEEKVTMKTTEDIKSGDVVMIAFKSVTYWSPDGKASIMFSLYNGTDRDETSTIKAKTNWNMSTNGWDSNDYYAFKVENDYPAGSDFDVYIGFNNAQSGFVGDLKLVNIGDSTPFKLVQYALGLYTPPKQTAKFALESEYDNGSLSGYKKMAKNDAITVTFKEPVGGFQINDFSLDNDGQVTAFEQSDDKKTLTLHFGNLKNDTKYLLSIENVVTDEVDTKGYTYKFMTQGDIVVNKTVTGSPLVNGDNTLSISVNNATGAKETVYLVAAVFPSITSSKVDFVNAVKKSDLGEFDTLSVNVPITNASSQIVKLYIWQTLEGRAPLWQEITVKGR